MEVVHAIGEDRKAQAFHLLFHDLLFVSVWQSFGIQPFGSFLAQGVVERLPISGCRLEGQVTTVARDLLWHTSLCWSTPDFKRAGTFRCEINRASIARPTWQYVVSRTLCQLPH